MSLFIRQKNQSEVTFPVLRTRISTWSIYMSQHFHSATMVQNFHTEPLILPDEWVRASSKHRAPTAHFAPCFIADSHWREICYTGGMRDLGSKEKQETASEASPTEFKHNQPANAQRVLHNRRFLVPALQLAHNQKSSQVQWIPPSIRKKDVSFNKCDAKKSVLLNWQQNPPFISHSQPFMPFVHESSLTHRKKYLFKGEFSPYCICSFQT